MNTIAKVLEFHEAFGCGIGVKPKLPERVNTWVGEGEMHLLAAVQCFRAGAAQSCSASHRLALVAEETAELVQALKTQDTAATLDALVDLRYVLDGAVIEFGMHALADRDDPYGSPSIFQEAFCRVHAANMAKLGPDGKPLKDAAGKVCKPAGWVAPDLSDLIC